ncbi:HTH-type transcriptional regulator YofA [compost metagenome]
MTTHIQQLEEQFNATLFRRAGKHVQLTAQGEIWLEYAKQIASLVEEAAAKMKSAEQPTRMLSL